jgi:adenosylhomocysteine nucleosidase
MPNQRIALICAMPMELKPLIKRLRLRQVDLGGVTAHEGNAGGRDVVAIYTGMGTKLAAEATERLLDATSVDRVLVVGITGAVEDDTPIGTMVWPEAVVDSASGAEFRPDPWGAGGEARGKMWTGDVLITDVEYIAALRANGVVSLDMETAAIAEVCERRGVPWGVFRAISDRATDGSITEEVFKLSNQDGTPNAAAAAKYFARHPEKVPVMAKLARGAKRATENAASAAIRACATAPD